LNGLPGVPRATVIILGAGTLGRAAAQAFVGIGAQVIVLDNDMHKLRAVDELFSGTVSTMVANEYNLNRVVSFADVVLGAVLRAGERAPVLITRAMVRRMRPGAVIIDFSIDQGGCVETSRPMSLRDSTFVAEGVTHFCVPNATAMVARTASHALTNSALPYLLEIGEHGLERALARDTSLSRGIKVFQGQVASHRLAAALGQEVEVDLAGLLRNLQGSAQ
jgi:alanine dehydrogenase